MNNKEIKSVWAAWQEVQEKKKAPVTNKDDDGEGMDPVGKEDGDIDNDGDKDSSDDYLKNRRKKVGKEIEKDKKEGVKEGEESPYPSLDKKKREKKGSNLEPAGGPADKLKGESVEGKMKESSLFTDAELEAIEEKMKQPNDDASAGEPFMSTNSEGEKKFAADHKKSDKKFEDMESASEEDAAKAGRGVKSQSPTRRGESRTGDIAMEKPTKAAGQ